MSIHLQPEPPGARDFINSELSARLGRGEHLTALQGTPAVGNPLPVYSLTVAEASSSVPLSHAHLTGWRYPVAGGATPGLALVLPSQGRFEFAGLTQGNLPRRFLAASQLVEDNVSDAAKIYDARLLEIHALRLTALWLASQTTDDDLFVVLMDGHLPETDLMQIERNIGQRIANALSRRPTKSKFSSNPTLRRANKAATRLPFMRFLPSFLFLVVPLAQHRLPFLSNSPLIAWILELAFAAWGLWAFGAWWTGLWFGVLVDGRNKISLSRIQMILWTVLFATSIYVIYIWDSSLPTAITFGDTGVSLSLAAPTIPDAAWVLMGISSISAAATPLILSSKTTPDPNDPPAPPADSTKFLDGVVVKRKAGERPEWSDLILGDEAGNADAIDISKVQQLLLSCVAIVVYGFALGATMLAAGGKAVGGLPPTDSGFLALIGASHMGYLLYKAVPHSN